MTGINFRFFLSMGMTLNFAVPFSCSCMIFFRDEGWKISPWKKHNGFPFLDVDENNSSSLMTFSNNELEWRSYSVIPSLIGDVRWLIWEIFTSPLLMRIFVVVIVVRNLIMMVVITTMNDDQQKKTKIMSTITMNCGWISVFLNHQRNSCRWTCEPPTTNTHSHYNNKSINQSNQVSLRKKNAVWWTENRRCILLFVC